MADIDFDFDLCKIQHVARTKGLMPHHIMQVVSAIESRKAFIKKIEKLELMKCLIPSKSIPEEAFLRMSRLLGSLELSTEIKEEILKWMIAVYSFVKSLERFRLLYELFLKFLEESTLQPYVCHLLYLLTDKNHVTPRRVKYLRKVIDKQGYQPCLFFLYLAYYKQSPDLFEEEVNESFEYHFSSLGIYPDLIKGVHSSYSTDAASIHISTCESDSSDTTSCITFEKEGSSFESHIYCEFREIFHELETLKKTKNISKILKSKYRRLFLTSDMPIEIKIKVYDYILTSLYDEDNYSSRDFLLDILEIFYDMQGSMVAVSNFTEILISSWDGKTNLDINTAMLQYQPICCFEEIIYKMDLIREHLFKADVRTKCHLLYCVSKMYENWILLQHDRYSSIECHECLPSDDKTLCSSSFLSHELSSISHEPKEEINKLGFYIDFICNTLIVDDITNPCLLNEILLHYERMSIIHMEKYGLGAFHLPTYQVFGASLFSFSSLTLDNLCHLMLRYNNEIKKMHSEGHEDANYATKCFKLYSNDIHNFLFEGSIKNTFLSKKEVFTKLKELYRDVNDILCLHRHPALYIKIDSFFQKYPKYKGSDKSEVKSKKKSARKDFLNYLSEDGLKYLTKFESLV